MTTRAGGLDRVLVPVGRALLRTADPSELVQQVCRLLLSWGAFDRVRITQNRNQVLVTAADAGEGDAPPFFWEKHVLEGARAVVNPDLALGGDARFQGWRTAALYPLRVGGTVWGCLGLYAREPGGLTVDEEPRLRELADDLGFALQTRAQDQRRRESEQFLGDMANLMPGVFYKLRYKPDEGLRFLYASPGVDLLLPLSAAQVQADPSRVFGSIHPRDRRRFFRAGMRSLKFLTVFSLEFRLIRPNGAIVWVLGTAFPQKLEESVVWTGLAIDVTPQNKLQEALQREQELLSVVLNNIGDGVVAVDEAGQLALVNRAATRLLGKPDAPTQGPWRNLDADLPWNNRDHFRPWYRHNPDGSLLHLEAHVSDLTDGQGRPRGRVLLLRDMTDRDRIEDRLRQSEKLESIGLLAGGIAHDFNNLLTGVFGFIQLAQMNSGHGDKVVAYLTQAQEPFQRARALTRQLLTFAKGGEVPKTAVALEEAMERILGFSLSNGPPWTLHAPPGLWSVLANEAQLHQVFENLVVNARQSGAEAITVSLANVAHPGPSGRDLKPGPYVEVVVTDDGGGIAPEVLAKVFDPFFTTKTSGTGLGLSICFSVVRKHAGAIEVESPAPGGTGRGTAFRVFWPAVTPAGA